MNTESSCDVATHIHRFTFVQVGFIAHFNMELITEILYCTVYQCSGLGYSMRTVA